MKEIKKTVEKLGEGIVSSIKENMSSYNQEDSNLAKSLRFEADEESLKIYAADYWDFSQKGRGPGGLPHSWESIMKDWISRHSVKFDGDERTFIQNVKWKTIREGSRLYRHPSEQRNFLKGVVEKNLEIFEKEISETLIETIEETTKKVTE